MDTRSDSESDGGTRIDDHVIRELFGLCLGLQGLVPVQARQENRVRLAGYVDRLDALIRSIRVAGGLSVTGGETLPQRLLTTVEDQSVVLGLPVHVEFRGRLDLSAELSDRIVLVVRDAMHNIACHANASSACLRVGSLDGFVTVEITDDGRDLNPAARINAQAGYRGALGRTAAVGTHLTWTACVR